MQFTRASRAILAVLSLVIALFLAFLGGFVSGNASDLAPSSGNLAYAALWIAVGGLAISVFLSGALLGEEDSLARGAFRVVLVVDAAWLLIMLSIFLR